MAVPSTRTPPPSIRRLASLVEGARLACLSRAPMPSGAPDRLTDRKSTRLNSSHLVISYAVFCLKKKTTPVHDMELLRVEYPFSPSITVGMSPDMASSTSFRVMCWLWDEMPAALTGGASPCISHL